MTSELSGPVLLFDGSCVCVLVQCALCWLTKLQKSLSSYRVPLQRVKSSLNDSVLNSMWGIPWSIYLPLSVFLSAAVQCLPFVIT